MRPRLIVAFEFPAGSLDSDDLRIRIRNPHIHVSFIDDGIRSLASPGVQGLYTDEQALIRLLDDSGVTYRFTADQGRNAAPRRRSTSVNVTADASDDHEHAEIRPSRSSKRPADH